MKAEPEKMRVGLGVCGGLEVVPPLKREQEAALAVTGAESLFHALESSANPARAGERADSEVPLEIELV
ncbi:hypothetical protein [Asticcacaulis sp. AND118]|uniref:hypothetical protein n=1 Tax=Asticcacaulis sp. AND118 TaxID=2840468 RepID=UPI001CFFF092|nr:hypothetical protein [Asticcacaulis sp. AND118]UDF04211.1 hypothetical protein LH365_03990 [Asticcacaulis sp. AND118]